MTHKTCSVRTKTAKISSMASGFGCRRARTGDSRPKSTSPSLCTVSTCYNGQQTQSIDFYAEMLRISDVKKFSKPNCWQCVHLNEVLKQLNKNLVLSIKDKSHGFDELCRLKLNPNDTGCGLECMDQLVFRRNIRPYVLIFLEFSPPFRTA